MGKRLAATAVALAALALAAGSPAVAATDAFTGSWSAIDGDGSRMKLSISGGGETRDISLVDYRATICGGEPAGAEAIGTVSGDELHAIGAQGCTGAEFGDAFDVTYSYESETGTLFDGAITWRRGHLSDAFLGVWRATDTDGSALTVTFGGSGLTRDVSFFDALASSCEPDAPFSGTGVGTIGSVPGDGRFIRVVASGSCEGSSETFGSEDKYEYDYSTDTLIGPLEPLEIGGDPLPWTVVWHR